MEAKITKTIVTNEGEEFGLKSDVHFNLCRNDKTYDCFGVITDIGEQDFKITKVQLDKMNLSDDLTVKYSEVKDGILHYANNCWY